MVIIIIIILKLICRSRIYKFYFKRYTEIEIEKRTEKTELKTLESQRQCKIQSNNEVSLDSKNKVAEGSTCRISN